MRPLNVAVVGAGLMGRWHGYCASKAGAAVVAVIDPDVEAAARLAARCRGAAVFPALERALDERPIDVVHICTPTPAHFSLASLALARQKHVLVEKPMTASAGEAEQLVAAARTQGVLIAPVHQLPFQRGFRRLCEERERLGPPARVTVLCCTAGGTGLDSPARRTVLLEILPHPLSLLYALFGEQALDGLELLDVIADSELELGATLNQARISVTVSLDARPTQLGLTYLGRRGTGHVDLFHGFYVREDGQVSRGAKIARPLVHGAKILGASGLNLLQRALRSERAYPGLWDLTRHFYSSIQHGQAAPIDEAEVIGTARALDRFRPVIDRGGERAPAH